LKFVADCTDKARSDLSATALQSLQPTDAQLESRATKIASLEAVSPKGANLDLADFSAEMATLMTAQAPSSADLATLKTAAEIQKKVIDLMAEGLSSPTGPKKIRPACSPCSNPAAYALEKAHRILPHAQGT
jgi:hypothetical protein